MSGPGNGSPVTWRELTLALDPIREDIKDAKTSLDIFHAEFNAFRTMNERRAFLGARGRVVVNGLLVAVPAALVAAVVSFLH